ncbi:MAG: hypothetical protein A2487_00295 [Candidatus Raymondbacteria bacterium RifOxyC12_full_50_8]|uniref:FlgD Ig-like domain-containing protein n=1 Tax=Candidatus Raymondbacteria bacterium RIFOXYD12_FULL_49_13 TaxID=1817890 RepID=A0A1F7FG12_UNCRA|nr:MAG: hypothetical protein A2248_11670 [Candidatus Raymondbacteria bacterium RIFOXYA2_FULL_49_16]OGJ99463.1 MAG: hypothetical protein A2350_16965 [Candidatus Raymondbacteria bacterium RifOxyB12_full_50_8]OGK03858.1 MAG: hypothetical protein A2487_00295 [Candidatus Raymondbacteria bacterium RifOxyC12_full_50_8]OGK05635.1 MAG: hypothetical protein A2519_07340 [Candidatus Raymondbacteria bacterium RIFOXYD12_FULL_49_13]OGP41892.1 MAG: hypothetical protein A2324_08320 [Candidatus Raymondbacteria b
MRKLLSTILVLGAVFQAFGQKDTVQVYKIDATVAHGIPTMDGDLADWDEGYNVGGFTSEDNIYYVSGGTMDSWDGFSVDYQASMYLAHDETYLYIGWRTLADDYVKSGVNDRTACDDMKICFGAKDDLLKLFNNSVSDSNPICLSYQYDHLAGVRMGVHPDLPVYELRLRKDELRFYFPTVNPPFALVSIGTEDIDTPEDGDNYLGLKAKYTGTKTDGATNPWDNNANYPIVQFLDEYAPGVNIDVSKNASSCQGSMVASPNPFNPATCISYNVKGAGSIGLYSIAGKLIRTFPGLIGKGAVAWDGKDYSGNIMPAGVYIARLNSNGSVYSLKLSLLK